MTGVAKRAKHSAPGQYLGFGLQPIRLCYHLLLAPSDSYVSLEHADDVAVHYADGGALLEQTKSALSQNPLSDWAVDLWKAIANWLDTTTVPGPGMPALGYRLYVVPPRTGAFAAAMHAANTPQAVAEFVKTVKTALGSLKKKPACSPHVQRFLSASPAEQFHLISNLSIESADTDPFDPIRARLDLVVPAALDACCIYAVGLAKEQAEVLMRKGQPGFVNAGKFRAQLRHFISKNNLPLLLPFSDPPGPGEVASVLAGRPTFIRQLELISAPQHQRVRSVGDYLRASADKTQWADAGMIFPDSLNDWDGSLVNQHTAITDELDALHAELDDENRGKALYAKCRQVTLRLEGREVPDHFIHGCFHDLSDRRELGWHRDYTSLLDQDDK